MGGGAAMGHGPAPPLPGTDDPVVPAGHSERPAALPAEHHVTGRLTVFDPSPTSSAGPPPSERP